MIIPTRSFGAVLAALTTSAIFVAVDYLLRHVVV
jgi:hypothetical protein